MIGDLLALPIAGPLVAAGVLAAAPGRRWLGRTIPIIVTVGVLVLGTSILTTTMDGRIVTQNVAAWPPGVSIVLAADPFAALMILVTALVVLASLLFAMANGDDSSPLFTPLVLIMSGGVYGAFLTADLFNLFVFVEVMLVPSYVLLTMHGDRRRVSEGGLYLTVNLLASTLFLAGVALLYATAGTVNLAELAGAGRESTAIALAGGVVLLAMAIKAAVVPVHGWLPRTYPQAPPVVTALFSGLLSKVGVYALIRIYAVVFEGDHRLRWLILVVAVVTMAVGVLGAVGEQAMRSVLTFHMVSQIGYVLLGLVIFTTLGLAAAIFYLTQYILVKAALLVCAAIVESRYGTGELARLGALANREPWLALAFAVAALSLVGVPPLSGFVAKFQLVRAAAGEAEYVAAAAAIIVSLFTLLSMVKIWTGVFWGPPPDSGAAAVPAGSVPALARPALVLPALALGAFSVGLGVGAEPLLEVANAAGEGLVDSSGWVQAVMTP